MLKKRKVIARLLIFVMLLCIMADVPADAGHVKAAGKAPGLNAKVTKNNILKLLSQYDKDGAYILNKQTAKGENFLAWFSNGRIVDNIDTAVHEETHGYLYSYMNTKGRYFFGTDLAISFVL